MIDNLNKIISDVWYTKREVSDFFDKAFLLYYQKECKMRKPAIKRHSVEKKVEIEDPKVVEIYKWLDTIPQVKNKRNLSRDFSDGVNVAIIIKHYKPGWVDLHNYTKTLKTSVKKENWEFLNKKVFQKLFGLNLKDDFITQVSAGNKNAIEALLLKLKNELQNNTKNKFRSADTSRFSFANVMFSNRKLLTTSH